MKKGTVDRVVRERGFGFIRGERGESVFFHRSALSAGEFDRLEEGEQVEFEDTMGEKGLKATRVRLVGGPAATA
jgi:CspA family cold shock protein